MPATAAGSAWRSRWAPEKSHMHLLVLLAHSEAEALTLTLVPDMLLRLRSACCAVYAQQVAGRGAVKTVQVKGSDSSSWQTLNNIWGAAWETSYVPKPPLDFRIQDDTGVEVGFGVTSFLDLSAAEGQMHGPSHCHALPDLIAIGSCPSCKSIACMPVTADLFPSASSL